MNIKNIVLIHGFLGTPETDFGDLIDWLRTKFQVWTPVLKHKSFNENFYIKDSLKIIKFIEKNNLKDVAVLGYSDGGEVALLCAAQKPSLIKKVVTWGSIGFYGEKMKPYILKMYPPTWLDEKIKRKLGISDSESLVLEWVKSLMKIIDNKSQKTAYFLRKKIKCKVLMILGKHDFLNPIEYAQKFVKDIKNGKIKVLNCGHAIHEEKKREFRKIINDFLD